MLICTCFVDLFICALCICGHFVCETLSGKLKVEIWIIRIGLVHLARELDQAACLKIRIDLQTVVVLTNRLHVHRRLIARLNHDSDRLVHPYTI